MEPRILSEMGLTEEEIEAVKILEEHYGDIHSWKINHWKNYNEMLHVKYRQWLSEYNLGKDCETVDEKVNERLITLGLEIRKLSDLAIKVLDAEGLEPDEQLFLCNKLMNEARKLTYEYLKLYYEFVNLYQGFTNLMQDRSANPLTRNRKKPVGRPNSMIIYQWMDYLVSELGTKKKAADYASDSPMTDPKKPDSLLREYRRYLKLKEGT
jgi:hypothetical protein